MMATHSHLHHCRKTYKDREKELLDIVHAKQSLVETLEEEHEQLVRQASLAQQLLDSFDWFQRQHSTGKSMTSLDDLLLEAMLEDHELHFMQQLSSFHATSSNPAQPQGAGQQPSCSVSNAGSAGDSSGGDSSGRSMSLEAWQQPIAPESDMLLLARKVLAMGDFPGLQGQSLTQLGETASRITCKLALCLQQLEAGAGPVPAGRSHQQLLAVLEASLCKQMQLKKTLTLKNPTAFLQLLALNCDTGGLGVASMESYHFLVQQLHLSPQQKQRIAAAYAMAQHLMAPILRERQQLQGGAGSCAPATPGSLAGSSSNLAGSSCSNLGNGNPTDMAGLAGIDLNKSWDGYRNAPRPLSFANSDMSLQRFRVARLEHVTRKEWFMRLMASYAIKASLSWPQMAKVYVLMSPHFPQYCLLARAVQEQLDLETKGGASPDHTH